MNRVTIQNLALEIPTEADAYAYMEALRWPEKPICPHCGSLNDHYFLAPQGEGRKTRTGAISPRRVWKCKTCRKQFSVTTGTIFHGSKIPLQTWLFVTFEMCANKNGIAAREIERHYGLAPKTAWLMTQRLRKAMGEHNTGKFTGDVIADETWISGDPENMHADKRHGKPGAGTDKIPVVSLISAKTGEVRSKVIAHVDSASLCQVISEHADLATTTLHTDSAVYYGNVATRMAGHFAVNHKAGEYVSEKSLGTQICETFFSQLKRSLDGTHHHIIKEHLFRYVGEFDFRYSTCKMSDTERMLLLMGRTSGRLTYRPLTS